MSICFTPYYYIPSSPSVYPHCSTHRYFSVSLNTIISLHPLLAIPTVLLIGVSLFYSIPLYPFIPFSLSPLFYSLVSLCFTPYHSIPSSPSRYPRCSTHWCLSVLLHTIISLHPLLSFPTGLLIGVSLFYSIPFYPFIPFSLSPLFYSLVSLCLTPYYYIPSSPSHYPHCSTHWCLSVLLHTVPGNPINTFPIAEPLPT